MSDTTLTHKDLSTLLGVSETTVKSYRRKFPDCIPVANNGKPIRFTVKAKEVCFRIRDLFSTGMSVREVRLRLEEEFSWIPKSSKVKSKDGNAKHPSNPNIAATSLSGGELNGHVFGNINTMAKSMVTLQQQQLSMQKSLGSIEKVLDIAGLPPQNIAGTSGNMSSGALTEQYKALENAVIALGKVTENLDNLGKQLFAAFEETAVMQRNWAAGAISMERSLKSSFGAAESTYNAAEQNAYAVKSSVEEGEQNTNSSKIIPIRNNVQVGGGADNYGAEAQTPVVDNSPPRHLLGLPLVVRTPEGNYISAGASRGKVSLNDLKAILAQAFLPPEDYIMHWKNTREGWWVILEKSVPAAKKMLEDGVNIDTSPVRNFRMLVAEQVSSRGIKALEVSQLLENSNIVHPTEICSFIAEI